MKNYKMEYSKEQKSIIEAVSSGKSVIVDAVAGSGKTTTILGIIKEFPESIVIVLTYNARLKQEVREKIETMNIKNAEIHTYHSLAVKYYNSSAFTDKELQRCLSMSPKSLPNPDILILDESQDLTPVLYEFSLKFMSDQSKIPGVLCLLGDTHQCIYRFNDANPYFLTEARELFPYEFTNYTLSTSYRVTDKIAGFVNHVLLKHKRLSAVKTTVTINDESTRAPPVQYIISDPYDNRKNYEIMATFKKTLKNYKYTEMMILAPSVRIKSDGKQNPVSHFANKVSDLGIPIYVPNSDQEKVESCLYEGKLPFLSFHQSKGLEAKVVFVFGMDESYFKFYDKSSAQDVCPNTIYVACTRAKELLNIIHSSDMDYLPFVDEDSISRNAKVIGSVLKKKSKKVTNEQLQVSITDLTRNIPSSLSRQLEMMFTYSTVKKESKKILKIPLKIKTKTGLLEDVSDITGTAIGAYYQYRTSGNNLKILDILIGAEKVTPDAKSYDLTVQTLLHYANMYNAYVSFYDFKLKQITEYTYLGTGNVMDSAILSEVYDRMSGSIPKPYLFEKEVSGTCLGIKVSGRIDCFSGRNIWEIKCVSSARLEHFLQVILYQHLITENQEEVRKQFPDETTMSPAVKGYLSSPFNIKLFNVIEDTEYHVKCDKGPDILKMLIYNYKYGKASDTLETFLKACKTILSKYKFDGKVWELVENSGDVVEEEELMSNLNVDSEYE